MTIPEHYYAVIFTEISSGDDEGYSAMAARMRALAEKQPGHVGFENYVSTDNQMTGQKKPEKPRGWMSPAERGCYS